MAGLLLLHAVTLIQTPFSSFLLVLYKSFLSRSMLYCILTVTVYLPLKLFISCWTVTLQVVLCLSTSLWLSTSDSGLLLHILVCIPYCILDPFIFSALYLCVYFSYLINFQNTRTAFFKAYFHPWSKTLLFELNRCSRFFVCFWFSRSYSLCQVLCIFSSILQGRFSFLVTTHHVSQEQNSITLQISLW